VVGERMQVMRAVQRLPLSRVHSRSFRHSTAGARAPRS
jgi:hypothetical protein